MAWYAYCIGERQAFPALERHRKPVPWNRSLESVAIRFLSTQPAILRWFERARPQAFLDQKSGVDHARVISDCFRHSTVLPFRFGTVFHDDETLRKSIRSNQRQFLGNIDKLRVKPKCT